MQIVGRTRKWVQAQKNDGHAAHAQTSKSSKTDMMPELQLDILPAFCPRQEKKWVPPLSDGSGKRANEQRAREGEEQAQRLWRQWHLRLQPELATGIRLGSEVSLAGKPTRTFRLPWALAAAPTSCTDPGGLCFAPETPILASTPSCADQGPYPRATLTFQSLPVGFKLET